MIITVVGKVGCLHSDTLINIHRNGAGKCISIKRLYHNFSGGYRKTYNMETPTYVRSYDKDENRIKLHRIENVIKTGIKQLFLLELEDGKTIKCTKDHKFMTENGFKKLENLNNNDKIMCDSLLPQKNLKKSFKLPDVSIHVEYHPFKNKNNKIEVHRLVYESYINKLKFTEFLDIIWNDENLSKKLKFVNPKKYAIHHKDGNHYNNNKKNLIKISKDNHAKLHSIISDGFKHFNQGVPYFVKIKSILKIGKSSTYDICCKDPIHNYVANGMVVHNSGKSYSTARIVKYFHDNGYMIYANCEYKLKNYERILKQEIIENPLDPKIPESANYWKTRYKRPCLVIIDEASGWMDSRSSMSKENKIMTRWISQIRKIIGEKEDSYLIIISQLASMVDVRTRGLSQIYIHMRKLRKHPPLFQQTIFYDTYYKFRGIEDNYLVLYSN